MHLLTGTNEHEMTLFQILDPTLADLDDAQMIERLRPWADDPARLLHEYRAASPDATPQQIWLALTTDGVFRIPAIKLVEAQLAHGPSWMYRFSWETPAFGGILRSTHAIEIPFVFDNLDRNTEGVTGEGPERQGIADTMHRAWIAFARTGDPGWPAYDTAAPCHDALRRRIRDSSTTPKANNVAPGAPPPRRQSAGEEHSEDRDCDQGCEREGESDPRAAIPTTRLGIAAQCLHNQLMVFTRTATHEISLSPMVRPRASRP